jgi:hypothetical protein
MQIRQTEMSSEYKHDQCLAHGYLVFLLHVTKELHLTLFFNYMSMLISVVFEFNGSIEVTVSVLSIAAVI